MPSFLGEFALQPCLVVTAGPSHRDIAGLVHDLVGHTVDFAVRRAQYLMAGDDVAHRRHEGVDIARSGEPRGERDVVDGSGPSMRYWNHIRSCDADICSGPSCGMATSRGRWESMADVESMRSATLATVPSSKTSRTPMSTLH